MRVKQLIAKLKTMPPDAIVYKQDHDHGEPNTNGEVESVGLHYKKAVLEDLLEFNNEIGPFNQDCLDSKPSRWVTLR